jgi:hypothetical protein
MNIELSEELGIPKDLDNYAINVLNKFIMGFRLGAPENIVNDKNGYYNRVHSPKKFLFDNKSVEINDIDITLYLNINNSLTDEIDENSASLSIDVGKILPNKKNPKVEILVEDIPEIAIKLDISSTTTKDDVFYYLKDKFSENASTLAHELKHYIDAKLGKTEKLSYRTKSNVISALLNNENMLPSLRVLFFDMYFISVTENLVRPTEFKTIFTSKKLTKKDFLNKYLNSEFYLVYKRIENRTYEEFIYRVSIDIFKQFGPNMFYAGAHDDYLFNLLETIENIGSELILRNVKRFANDTNYSDFVLSNVRKDSDKDFLKKQFLIKRNSLGEINAEETFKALILNTQNTARKMKRKMAKVYAAIPDKY